MAAFRQMEDAFVFTLLAACRTRTDTAGGFNFYLKDNGAWATTR